MKALWDRSVAWVMAVVNKVIAWALTLKAVRVYMLYLRHRGTVLADSVTYRALFGIFAGVLLGFTIAARWLSDNPEIFEALITAVDAVIPGLIGEDGIIDPATITAPAGISIAMIVSIVGLALAAIGAIATLRTAMRLIAGTANDDIAYIWVLLRNLALGVGIGAALLATAVLTTLAGAGVDLIAHWLGVSGEGQTADTITRWAGILIVFALDAAAIAVLFRVLSGVKPRAWTLWSGALIGAFGLTVLQQLSGLFVGGATSNPLLVSFASLIALLLWVNLSVQVILLASTWIVVGVQEQTDRVRARHGAETFAQLTVRQAEDAVRVATADLERAREAERREREGE